jgi:putative ABC transport system permease protein
MHSLWHDLRYGWRMLLKRPGFSLIAVTALALGIGLNSAVFSLINAILLKPLNLPELDRIVALWETVPSQGMERNETAVANYVDWRAQSSSFEQLALYTWSTQNLTAVEPPERVRGFRVTPNLLDTVGIKPMLGRNFTAEEGQPGQDGVALLTYGLWQRRFGGDPQIVGKTIVLNGLNRTVVGVLPQGMNFPRGGEVLIPLAFTPQLANDRSGHGYLTVGRLKAGVTVEQAQQDLTAIARRLEQQYPQSNTGRGVVVRTLVADTVRNYKPATLASFGAVCFVLLIACANVANLLLARAAERTKEIAVRVALGASRWRILRQLLLESTILACIGGAFGVLVALWGVEALKAALPDDAVLMMPGLTELGINPRVLAYTAALSLVTGVLFGLAPAWQASRPNVNETLKESGGKAASGAGRQRLRGALVVAEIALALVLLIGAGLLMKSFLRLMQANPGFNPDNVLTMSLTLPVTKYKEPAQRAEFYQQLERRVAALPGVEAVGFINYLPLGGSNSSSPFLPEGRPAPPPGQEFMGRYRACTPQYFQSLGIRLLKGRLFTERDTADAPPVIVVNETLARQYWPQGDAVGKRLRLWPTDRGPWREVVGVVNDVQHEMNSPVTPDYYLPHAQDPWSTMVLTVRTKTEPLALVAAVRSEVQALDRDQPVYEVRTMATVRDRSIIHFRFASVVFGIYGLLALVLAATGIYGVMSYAVSQRTHEIGVRMALGAQAADVVKLVIKQGMVLTLGGLACGLLIAFAVTSAMKTILYEVKATDSLTFTLVTLALAAIALLACYLPARRATKVDPLVALRYE